MKKMFLLGLFLVLVLLGCSKSYNGIELDFSPDDIESLEVYSYEGLPRNEDRLIISDREIIEEVYNFFSQRILIKDKDIEPSTGNFVLGFNFKLDKDKDYSLVYISQGVKKASLEIPNQPPYFVASDLRGWWDTLIHEYSK